MDSTDLLALHRRCRRSYELGRLRFGLYGVWWALPALAISVFTASTTGTLVIGGLLALSIVGLRCSGQAYGRAILPGLVAGTVPLVLPLLLRGTGHACFGGACLSVCMLGCVAGGLAAGATIGWRSAREGDQRWAFLVAATLLSGLTGSLGCAVVGLAGTAGMLLATIASSLPVALAVHARTS